MAPTATAVKEEVTHKPSIGSVTGSTVVATTAGIGTAAIGTKIAKDGWQETWQNVRDHSSNSFNELKNLVINKKQEVENANISSNTTLNEVTEEAKNFGDNFKDKAGEVFESLKNGASGLKNDFNKLDNTKKALVVIPAAIAFALAAIATHAKLSEVRPETDKYTTISKGVINAKTTELEIPESYQSR